MAKLVGVLCHCEQGSQCSISVPVKLQPLSVTVIDSKLNCAKVEQS